MPPSTPLPPGLFLIIRDYGDCTQLKLNKGARGDAGMCATTFVISASVTAATFPRLFSFLISSLDSLASLISRYPVQCYPCYLTQFDEKSRKCFVFQTIAWPGLGCGERQELLLKNDSQTSLILFLFPKINEKGSLEKAES